MYSTVSLSQLFVSDSLQAPWNCLCMGDSNVIDTLASQDDSLMFKEHFNNHTSTDSPPYQLEFLSKIIWPAQGKMKRCYCIFCLIVLKDKKRSTFHLRNLELSLWTECPTRGSDPIWKPKQLWNPINSEALAVKCSHSKSHEVWTSGNRSMAVNRSVITDDFSISATTNRPF
jgi:hypothetical protein